MIEQVPVVHPLVGLKKLVSVDFEDAVLCLFDRCRIDLLKDVLQFGDLVPLVVLQALLLFCDISHTDREVHGAPLVYLRSLLGPVGGGEGLPLHRLLQLFFLIHDP